MANFKEYYTKTIVPKLQKKLGLKNCMEIPKIEKIVLNMGVGSAAVADKKVVEVARINLEKIAGQKAVITRARKSIAGFKIREDYPIGCKVTLRNEKMYDFLERLLSIVIPRVRDFRGLSPKSFDGQGNYSLGIKEQIVFPEIDFDRVDTIRGLDITIVTSATTNAQGLALLQLFNFPFKQQTSKAA
ncbi:MAG: 50S ribosomal protein L5 [Legionellales bacterium]|nr:MAG: 50S ribosomal protein L5 [Legionellales bacterium]